MFKRILATSIITLFTIFAIAQTNVGIGTSNPNARLDVEGNKISYDLLKVANDLDATPDSSIFVSKLGNMSLGIASPGSYRLLSLGSPAAFSPQVEVWNGDPNTSGTMLADIVDASGFNGIFRLYLLGSKTLEFRAGGNSYMTGGNLGIGISNPLESIHLSGAAVVGNRSQVGTEVPGTISFDGSNWWGWLGPGTAVQLDVQNQPDGDWIVGTNFAGGPELTPALPGSSMSLAPAGPLNSFALTWLTDLAAPNAFPIQLMLETDIGPQSQPYDAAMMFRRSDWSIASPPGIISEYWMGIYNGDNSFMLSNALPIVPAAQADNQTMMRTTNAGIVSHPNQSRVRATVTLIDWSSWQIIPPSIWTPVNYTNPIAGTPLVAGVPFWDEQAEFTVASTPNQAVPPPNSFFTTTEEGFYQVNARCEFETDEYIEGTDIYTVYMRPNAYVSIAIYIDVGGTGQWVSYAIGNNLQITNNVPLISPPPEYEDATETMYNNNAPNVADVVYLQPGDRISIWVFQWAYTPMMLRPGDDVLYVSIHKSS
jgi:hypothetical protein